MSPLLSCVKCNKLLSFKENILFCDACNSSLFVMNHGLCLASSQEPSLMKVDRTLLQTFMEKKSVAQIYSAYWRPLGFLNLKGLLSDEDEYQLLTKDSIRGKSLDVDVCCGPGHFTERIAKNNPLNKVVGNIPYNITSPLLERLIGRLGSPLQENYQRLVLLLQIQITRIQV